MFNQTEIYWVEVFSHLLSSNISYVYSFKQLIHMYIKCEWYKLAINEPEWVRMFDHLAHMIVQFIIVNEENVGIINYIEFLCFLCKLHKVNPHKVDVFGNTALGEYLSESKTRRYQCHITLALHHPWVIAKMQACVRRFLSKKQVIRMRLQYILNSIKLAPPRQIEYNYFTHFEGGTEYHKFQSHFKSVQH